MITTWNPIREIADLHERLNAMVEGAAPTDGATSSFVPPVDVYEDENAIVLKLEVPGMKADDIDIRMENNKLQVRGERKFESEQKQENFLRVERRYGTFLRSFTLPSTIDGEKIEAGYVDGVLTITLAKRPEAQPKQIKVNANARAQKTIEA